MTYDWPLYFCLFLALWSAVIAGVFSAFSEFVMSALIKTQNPGGIEAMQHINRDVIKTQFAAGIVAIAIFSILFALYGLAVFEGAPRTAILLAAGIYLPGVFMMTMFGSVPMNNRLESLDHSSEQACIYWREYGQKWTRLNHVRAVGSVLTAGLYLIAAIALIASGQV